MASNSEGGTRKLAAIMFTDVKDFSKKMGENEIAAMEVLKIHDDMMREIVAKYNGVVIKSLGDSFMVDFSSAVNAVRCAIEVQERFWEYNKDKTEFNKIQVRIGIHLGDVINVGNDIYGDGVNIAARIEAITEPNRISVSAEIYNQVKNKMPIRAYNMGATDLKNISEPVEVYQLLLDSIPELSEPSESAKQIPTRRRADAISAQEAEEATRVEEAKQKIDDEQQREQAEKQARANEFYVKAQEAFHAGDLDRAEEELKEIYRVVQIHYEAQMLLLQIEEKRAQLEEETRRRRVREEKQRKEEERKQKIQNALELALKHVDVEQYQEALSALQEVYALEPNNEQAKRIEKQVQLAEDARQERLRQEALAEEERQREEAAKLERQRSEELAKAAVEKAALRREAEQKPRSKRVFIIAGAVILVVVVAAVILLTRGSLKKPGTIAIFPFSASQTEQSSLGDALSVMVANNIARDPGMTVLDPSSAGSFATNSSAFNAQVQSLGLTHVVQGSVSVSGNTVALRTQLIQLADGKTIAESSLQGDLLDVGNLASQASAAILKSLDVEVTPRAVNQLTGSTEALTQYLNGFTLFTRGTAESVNKSIPYLQAALRADSVFPAAKAVLSDALLQQYEMQGERDKLALAQATDLAKEAVRLNPNSARAHLSLAEAFRYSQQFVNARNEITASLAIRSNNAACIRELTLLSLMQGNTDEALQYAQTAQKIDPQNYKSALVKGIVQLFKDQFEDAGRLFDQATALGGPDSLVTVNYKFRAWIGLDQEDRIITYCQQMINRADDRGKALLYYWIGRAYSLKGKYNESITNFDQGIQIADRVSTQDPRDASSLASFALLNARRGKSPKIAIQAIDRIMSFDSTSAAIRYWHARVHAIQNDKAGAISELGKAVAIEYSFPSILDPDFLSIWHEPQFGSTIVRNTGSGNAR
jgi:class 3 adenylate cyclase/TolB-like protein